MQVAQVIVLANHKGGCGKTTATGNIGAGLAQMGKRVLLIDADPQANLSQLFGIDDPAVIGARLEDALDRDDFTQAPEPWRARMGEDGLGHELAAGVHMLPCTRDLADVVSARMAQDGFEQALAQLCAIYAPDYDFILIDTPPGVGALSSQALLAARWVIVPSKPADFDVGGAIELADLIEQEIKDFNPQIELLGVLIGQVDRRWRLTRETREVLEQAEIRRLAVEIPNAVRVGSAPRYAAPTIVLEPDSRVATAYRQVATMLAALPSAGKAAA